MEGENGMSVVGEHLKSVVEYPAFQIIDVAQPPLIDFRRRTRGKGTRLRLVSIKYDLIS